MVLDVMEKLVKYDVNRLVIVDDDDKVEGVVTVSDMIDFLVLRHSSSSSENSPIRRNNRARARTVSESVSDNSDVKKNRTLSGSILARSDDTTLLDLREAVTEVDDHNSDSVYNSWRGVDASPDSPPPPVWFNVVC